MTDIPERHEMGANNPPEPTLIERLAVTYGEGIQIAAMAAASPPLKVIGLEDTEALDEAVAYVRRMTAYEKRLEELRKEAKAPLDEAVKTAQAFFKPTIDKVVAAKASVLGVINAHNKLKADAEARAYREAAELERQRAAEQAAAAATIETAGGTAAGDAVLDHAVRSEEMAERMDRKASGPVADLVRQNVGGGVVSGSTVWTFEIVDQPALRATLGALGDHFTAADIEKAVRSYMAQQKKIGGKPALPGVTFGSEQKAIVR